MTQQANINKSKSSIAVVSNASILLKNFLKEGIRREVLKKKESVLENSDILLKKFIAQNVDLLVNIFNPIEILLPQSLNEDNHSDLMAKILDPRKKHHLGCKGFLLLLEIIKKKHTEQKVLCNAIQTDALRNGQYIHVQVRKRDQLSATDIKIIGNDFIVGIENKKTFGGEHTTTQGWQTHNQYKDLVSINKKNTLYVYIHPAGFRPKCKEAVVLDKDDIAKWYGSVAQQLSDRELGAALIFYSRYYLKTI